jgi:hypothetical protein
MEFMHKQESKANWSKKKASIAKAIYDDRCKEELAGIGTFSLNEASLLGSNEYEDFSGDFLTNLKNGYIEFIDHLASKIPRHKLRLNEVVKKIQKTDDSHFNVISFNSETGTETVYRCDRVLCTISLGCLKAIHHDLFEPSLPENKVNAIERLGFGTVNKLFVFFDEPVFKKHAQGFTILWQLEASFNLDSVQKYNLQVHMDFVLLFEVRHLRPKIPKVLDLVWILGSLWIFWVGPAQPKPNLKLWIHLGANVCSRYNEIKAFILLLKRTHRFTSRLRDLKSCPICQMFCTHS